MDETNGTGGWEAVVAADGRTYYWHSATGETSWVTPASVIFQTPADPANTDIEVAVAEADAAAGGAAAGAAVAAAEEEKMAEDVAMRAAETVGAEGADRTGEEIEAAAAAAEAFAAEAPEVAPAAEAGDPRDIVDPLAWVAVGADCLVDMEDEDLYDAKVTNVTEDFITVSGEGWAEKISRSSFYGRVKPVDQSALMKAEASALDAVEGELVQVAAAGLSAALGLQAFEETSCEDKGEGSDNEEEEDRRTEGGDDFDSLRAAAPLDPAEKQKFDRFSQRLARVTSPPHAPPPPGPLPPPSSKLCRFPPRPVSGSAPPRSSRGTAPTLPPKPKGTAPLPPRAAAAEPAVVGRRNIARTANAPIAGTGAGAPPPPPRVALTPADMAELFPEPLERAAKGQSGGGAVAAGPSFLDSMKSNVLKTLNRSSSSGEKTGDGGMAGMKAAAEAAVAMDRLTFRLMAAQRSFNAVPEGERGSNPSAANAKHEMAECFVEMEKIKATPAFKQSLRGQAESAGGGAAEEGKGSNGGAAFALNPLMMNRNKSAPAAPHSVAVGQLGKRGSTITPSSQSQPPPSPGVMISPNGLGGASFFGSDSDGSSSTPTTGKHSGKGEKTFDPACGLLAAGLAAAAGLGQSALHVAQEDFAQKVVDRKVELTSELLSEKRVLAFPVIAAPSATTKGLPTLGAPLPPNYSRVSVGSSSSSHGDALSQTTHGAAKVPTLLVEDLAPEGFRAVRKAFRYGFGAFAASMGEQALKGVGAGGGRSGAAFYVTADERFIVKSTPATECDFLLVLLAEYVDHIITYAQHTLLPRFLGLFRIRFPQLPGSTGSNKTTCFVVMPNLFKLQPTNSVVLKQLFDLKGSQHSRYVDTSPKKKDDKAALPAATGLKDSSAPSSLSGSGLSKEGQFKLAQQAQKDKAALLAAAEAQGFVPALSVVATSPGSGGSLVEGSSPLSGPSSVGPTVPSEGVDASSDGKEAKASSLPVLKDLNFCPFHGGFKVPTHASTARVDEESNAMDSSSGCNHIRSSHESSTPSSAFSLAQDAASASGGGDYRPARHGVKRQDTLVVTDAGLVGRPAHAFSDAPPPANDACDTASSGQATLAQQPEHAHRKLWLGADRKAVFMSQLTVDTNWLMSNGIMDYSLLLGIGTCSGGRVLGEKRSRASNMAKEGGVASRRMSYAASASAAAEALDKASAAGRSRSGTVAEIEEERKDAEELDYLLTRTGKVPLTPQETSRIRDLMTRAGDRVAAARAKRHKEAGVNAEALEASRMAALAREHSLDEDDGVPMEEESPGPLTLPVEAVPVMNAVGDAENMGLGAGSAEASSPSPSLPPSPPSFTPQPVSFWEGELGGVCASAPHTNRRLTLAPGAFAEAFAELAAVEGASAEALGSAGGGEELCGDITAAGNSADGEGGWPNEGQETVPAEGRMAAPKFDRFSMRLAAATGPAVAWKPTLGRMGDEGADEAGDDHTAGAAPLPSSPSPLFLGSSLTPSPVCSSKFSGLQAGDAREWYTFGIIDILQKYNTQKYLEGAFKSNVLRKQGVSSVSAPAYAQRFVAFLDQHTA